MEDFKVKLNEIDQLIDIYCPDLKRFDSWYREGSFALVCKTLYEGKIAALKLFKDPDFKYVQDLEFHHYDLSDLKHPNMMEFYKVIKKDEKIHALICEFCGENNLEDVLSDLNLKEKLSLFQDLIENIEFLHSKRFCHNDIAIKNVSANPVKFIDYDLMTRFGFRNLSDITLGSLEYMSPEMIKRMPIFGESDVFSLGILLFRIIEGEIPYHNKKSDQNLMSERCTEKYINLNEKVETEILKTEFNLRELIQHMIEYASYNRPNISEVKERYGSWLQDFLKNNS